MLDQAIAFLSTNPFLMLLGICLSIFTLIVRFIGSKNQEPISPPPLVADNTIPDPTYTPEIDDSHDILKHKKKV